MDTGETIFKFGNGESRKSLLSEEGEIRTDDLPKKTYGPADDAIR